MRPSFFLLAPSLVLSAAAFLLFTVDASQTEKIKGRQSGFWLALAGLIAAAALTPASVIGQSIIYGHGMLIADGLSFALTWIALLTTFLVVVLSEFDRTFEGLPLAAYYGLLLLSATGLILVVSSNDFLMIFLSIELVGIPGFIMAAFQRKVEKSTEAGIKFFLIGAFSSAMLAYGISLVYGLTGSTSLSVLAANPALLMAKAPLALMATFFIIVSFGFKIALVPFHMWVPDTFEGAPTPVAAFLSVAPKIAGVAIALRVFNLTLPSNDLGALQILAILAALTMTIANVIGLQQTNVVRLLAYSSVAHMGYILLGLIAGGTQGTASVYLYGLVYLFMNLGAFTVVICLANVLQSTDLSAYAGLSKRSPLLSVLFVLFLISLAGIPPTAGFIAKFYVFAAAFNAGWLWLVLLASVNSVIAVGYYFKIIHAMYFKAPVSDAPLAVSLPYRLVLGVTSFVTLFVGLLPGAALARVERLATRPASAEAAAVAAPAVAPAPTPAP